MIGQKVDIKDASDSESDSADSVSTDLLSISEIGDDFLSQYSAAGNKKISCANVGQYEQGAGKRVAIDKK